MLFRRLRLRVPTDTAPVPMPTPPSSASRLSDALVSGVPISNWYRLGDRSQRADAHPAPVETVTPHAPLRTDTVISIAGNRHDPDNPANVSQITQEGIGSQYRGYGILSRGVAYESTGSGRITGQQVETAER
jgi:hypothetical protein